MLATSSSDDEDYDTNNKNNAKKSITTQQSQVSNSSFLLNNKNATATRNKPPSLAHNNHNGGGGAYSDDKSQKSSFSESNENINNNSRVNQNLSRAGNRQASFKSTSSSNTVAAQAGLNTPRAHQRGQPKSNRPSLAAADQDTDQNNVDSDTSDYNYENHYGANNNHHEDNNENDLDQSSDHIMSPPLPVRSLPHATTTNHVNIVPKITKNQPKNKKQPLQLLPLFSPNKTKH